MHTIITPLPTDLRKLPAETASAEKFRNPSYDCREHGDDVSLSVYIPGVDAAGVEIEARGPDLIVTARKHRFVRINWSALHLETAQRDYQLRLRLGTAFDYPSMQAEIHDGVLTITIPKRFTAMAGARRVA